jgi:hypothetical protein
MSAAPRSPGASTAMAEPDQAPSRPQLPRVADPCPPCPDCGLAWIIAVLGWGAFVLLLAVMVTAAADLADF